MAFILSFNKNFPSDTEFKCRRVLFYKVLVKFLEKCNPKENPLHIDWVENQIKIINSFHLCWKI